MTTTNKFGNRIKKARDAKELSVRAAAHLVGISPGYFSNIETGKDKPPPEGTIGKMAKELDIDKDELIGLAHKVPGDLVNFFSMFPTQIAGLLRTIRQSGLTATNTRELIEKLTRLAKKGK